MAKIGPFFYIRNKLIYDAIPLEQGRRQADKLDNSYGHEALYDAHFKAGDYIDYPRGRVIWDVTEEKAIVYIDQCIEKPAVLAEIAAAFELGENFTVEHDDHYHCRRCVRLLFADGF